MPWLEYDSLGFNCGKFPLLGNVIIHRVEAFSLYFETEVVKMGTLVMYRKVEFLSSSSIKLVPFLRNFSAFVVVVPVGNSFVFSLMSVTVSS